MVSEDFAKTFDEARRPGNRNASANRKNPSPTPTIIKPYAWPDPASIPPRRFLYGRHYIRGNIGATIAAGGRAKTTLALTEAIGMAAGRNLITGDRQDQLRVCNLNGEEDQDELDRRVAAICQHYNIKAEDCADRLHVRSVRDKPLRLATMNKQGAALNRSLLDILEADIKGQQIDVLMLDPFVSFHSVHENDNGDMDLLLKEGLGGIAQRTKAAIEIFHHPGKPKPGQADTTVEDGRGASAILWAVRSARVLNFMAPEEAKQLGIAEADRRSHIRVENGKANMGPIGKADWLKIALELMPNGDQVACVSSWKRPNPFEGVTAADVHKCRTLARTDAYRFDSRSEKWIGYVVAEVLKINVAHGADNDPKDIARIKQILQTWFKNGVLKTEKRKDDTRHERTFVVPGPWQPDSHTADLDGDEFTLQ